MKAPKLALEAILAACFVLYSGCSKKTDYVVEVANHSRDKQEIERFNQSLAAKGYSPQTEITHLIDGATIYYSIFEMQGADKKAAAKKISKKINAYCDCYEKSVFYDEKEINSAIKGFMAAILEENAEKAASFLDKNVCNFYDFKKISAEDIFSKSFKENDYEKFRLDEIIYEKSAIIRNYKDAKEKFSKEVEKIGMKNGDYLVELNFKKGFLYDQWGFLFRKIDNKWKIIGIGG